MSDNQPDKSEKTEEPTPKKIADAVEKGNVPFSREAPIFASMVGILIVLTLMAPGAVPRIVGPLRRLLDDAGGIVLIGQGDAILLLYAIAGASAAFMAPMILLLGAFGLAAGLVQNKPRLVGERVKPKLSRISPKAGFKRIFGSHGVVEFLRSLFKFATVGIICVLLLREELGSMVSAIFLDPILLPGEILTVASRLVAAICIATIMLVAADILWSRFKWRKDLKMTRRELKDEMKQVEGDPLVKARLRSLAQDRGRRRMLSRVPAATLVVTNPTHYAVALSYKREEGGAPLVVAKGRDLVALRIREIATENEVPVIEDKALARALYESVEIDQWIPPEFYRAVAQLIYFLYQKEGRADAGNAP